MRESYRKQLFRSTTTAGNVAADVKKPGKWNVLKAAIKANLKTFATGIPVLDPTATISILSYCAILNRWDDLFFAIVLLVGIPAGSPICGIAVIWCIFYRGLIPFIFAFILYVAWASGI